MLEAGQGGTPMRRLWVMAVLGVFAGLGGCIDPDRILPGEPARIPHDVDGDGRVTRAELEESLRGQFARADLDGNGLLDARESALVNSQRFRADASSASPLQDWNQDGVISFDEFATVERSTFAARDRDEDGVVTREELRPRRARRPAW